MQNFSLFKMEQKTWKYPKWSYLLFALNHQYEFENYWFKTTATYPKSKYINHDTSF